ncbi:OsmC-like protein [Rubrobacter xylanophilus DSM 9941]|uniref:OsmC-like protein n=1 Tax=Rubrobacter xylanophilus (strain DSM 9941 / JCM 11954 / NBRC 16129 / PRD-1) TaxID=266117 RepID=Q1AY74_RUBXD|nr:OsmC family protein [Rubrobacter xylanophilus]ABG03654.1 OsmC-like protein [Rubrobacter xylanophilus DSM 9941]
MDLRRVQRPLKERYRREPGSSRITLRARGTETGTPVSCSVDIGRAVYEAGAHAGVGGPGTAACSGDLLLGALAACAQITCQMVAASLGVPTRGIEALAEGDLDLAGTLGLSEEVPVGFQEIRLTLAVDAPEASEEQLESLREKTERYCVVMQTLKSPPRVSVSWEAG